MIENIIESCQATIDSKISTIKSTRSNGSSSQSNAQLQQQTYESIIIPEANKILAELNKLPSTSWPKKLTISKSIDIYVEALAIHLLYTYSKHIKFNYPLHCVVNVLIKRPFLINIVQCGKNLNEWKEYSKELLNEISMMYGDTSSSKKINDLRSMLSQKYIESPSSIHSFHYLTGFSYESETTGITGEELLNKLSESISKDTIFISINVSYNLQNVKSIIVYQEIPKFREKLLNIDTIDKFNPFYQPKHIRRAETEYDLFDSKFNKIDKLPLIQYSSQRNESVKPMIQQFKSNENLKQIENQMSENVNENQTNEIENQTNEIENSKQIENEKIENENQNKSIKNLVNTSSGFKAFVVLCYNDSETPLQCHYSLANFGSFKYLSYKEAKDFIDHKILASVDSEIFDNYLKEEYYNEISSEKKDPNDLKKDYTALMQRVREAFNNSTKFTFADKLDVSGIIDPHEIPFFKIYLSKVKTLEPYDIQTLLNYVLSYIYPDLLVSSSSL